MATVTSAATATAHELATSAWHRCEDQLEHYLHRVSWLSLLLFIYRCLRLCIRLHDELFARRAPRVTNTIPI